MVWVRRLRRYDPSAAEAAETASVVVRELLAAPPVGMGPVHADLHDRQVLPGLDNGVGVHDRQVLSGLENGVGVVDWDTLARGEAALDLANLLVHLHLQLRVLHRPCRRRRQRRRQGRRSSAGTRRRPCCAGA